MNAYSISVAGASAGVPPGSGFGITIPGYFAGMNAKFGFNDSPHTFDIDVVQDSFGGSLDTLPEIGTAAKFYIGPDFFTVAGRVTHVEYSDTMSGTTATISLQDRRKDLDNVSIFTEDQGGLTTLDGRGILSVGSYLRESVPGALTSEDRRYVQNNEEGALYEDLRSTIINSPYVSGLGFDPENLFPEASIVESNLPITASGLNVSLDLFRWKFDGSSLRSVLTTVLNDLGFDWYWLLEGERVAIVNRAVDFQITEDNIPIPNSSGYTTNVRWGVDETDADDYVGILGARQEGFIDSDLLSPIDGLPTPSGIKFVKAWDSLTVGFYDSAGIYRTYIPPERELPLAMKGFDYWSVFKKHQTTLGFASDAGFLAAQDPNFQSRIDDKFVDQAIIDLIVAGGDITEGFPTLGGTQTNLDSLSASNKALVLEQIALTNYYSGKKYIPSKKSQNQNWIMEWYEKVKNIADNFYGRVYAAEGILIDKDYGLFATTDAAWGNVENQLPSGLSFGPNYAIDPDYQPLAPFIKEDTRVGAYAVLPAYTAHGKDGSESPDEFDRWNVDASKGHQYVPVNLMTVDNFTKDPRAAESPFLTYEPGTVVCQFGKIPGEALLRDVSLSSNPFVSGIFNENINSQIDFLDPTYLIKPYEYFDGSLTVPGHPLSSSGILSTADMGTSYCFDAHNVQNMSMASLPGGSGIIAYETIATQTTASDEVAYKNLLLDSNDFSTSNWTSSGAPTITKSYAGPFGAPFEATLIKNNTSGAGTPDGVNQSFSISAGKSYTCSFYVKEGVQVPPGIHTCSFSIALSGPSPTNHLIGVVLNASPSPTITTVLGTNTPHPIQEVGQGWYRVAFTFANVDNTAAQLSIYPSLPGTLKTESVLFYGAQVEEVVSGNIIDYPSEYLGHATSAKQTYAGPQGYGDGYSVAVAASGTTMVVGAPMTAASGLEENSGAIHIYDKVGSSWELDRTLFAPTAILGDHFGFDVDIDGDGDTIVVGSPGYKVSTGLANPSKVGRGYVYKRSVSATNILLDSNRWDMGIITRWRTIAGTPVILHNQNDPFGNPPGGVPGITGAWSIGDDDASLTEGMSTGNGGAFLAANSPYTFSLFVKEGTSIKSKFTFDFKISSTVTATSDVDITWSSGVPILTNTSGEVPTIHTPKPVGSGWYRVAVTYSGSTISTNNNCEWFLFPASTSTSSLGDIIVYGSQLEEGEFPNGWSEFDDYLLLSAPGYIGHTFGASLELVAPTSLYAGRPWSLEGELGNGYCFSTNFGGQLGWSVAIDDSGERIVLGAPFRRHLSATEAKELGGFDYWRKVSGSWVRLSEEVASSISGSPPSDPIPTAYYKFNDGGGTSWSSGGGPRQAYESGSSNTTVGSPLTSNNYYGTLVNGPTWVSNGGVSGPTCHSLHFDGANDYVHSNHSGLSSDLSLVSFPNNGPAELTFSSWFKCETVSSHMVIAMIGNSGFDPKNRTMLISDRDTPGDYRLCFRTGTSSTGSEIRGSTTIQPGVWYHGAVTYLLSSGLAKIYLDGTEETVGTGAVSLPHALTSADWNGLYLGAGGNWTGGGFPGTGGFFKGQLSDLGVWNAELTSTSISKIYAAQSLDTNSFQRFGHSIDISSDGEQVIVGTKNSDQVAIIDRVGATPGAEDFLFEGCFRISNPPGFDPTINPARGHSATFGTSTGHGNSVSIANGKRIVVGAPLESLSSTNDNKGAAYIYDYNETDSKWELFDKIYDIDGASHSNFGHSVSISSDGKIVTVGQPGETHELLSRAGAIQVWDEQTGRFMLNKKLFSESTAENNYYGRAIDVNKDGSIVAIGAGPWQAPDAGFREPGDLPNQYVGKPTTLTLAIPAPSKSGKSLGGWNDEIPLSYANVTEFRGKLLNFKQDGSSPTYWGDEYIFHEGPINCLDIESLYDDISGSGVFVLAYGSAASGVSAILGKVEDDNIGILGSSTITPDILGSEISTIFSAGAQEISVSRYFLNDPATACPEFVLSYKNSLSNYLNIAGSGHAGLTDVQWGGGDIPTPGTNPTAGAYGIATTVPVIDVDFTELRDDTFVNLFSSDWEEQVTGDPFGVNFHIGSSVRSTQFGEAVDLSHDGKYAVVGAPGQRNYDITLTPSAYVYKKTGNKWSLFFTPTLSSAPGDDDKFGTSAVISGDGTTVAIGSPNIDLSSGTILNGGSIHTYERSGDDWSFLGSVTHPAALGHDNIGLDISISDDGKHMVSTRRGTTSPTPGPGWFYFERHTSPSWSMAAAVVTESLQTSGAWERSQVKISGDGFYVVTAITTGVSTKAIRIYKRSSLSSAFLSTDLQYHISIEGVTGGIYIDCNLDASVIALGTPNTPVGEGAIYVIERKLDQGVYEVAQIIDKPMKSNLRSLGYSIRVSSSGDIIAAGCSESVGAGTNPPHVSMGMFVYEKVAGRYKNKYVFSGQYSHFTPWGSYSGSPDTKRYSGFANKAIAFDSEFNTVLIGAPYRVDPTDNTFASTGPAVDLGPDYYPAAHFFSASPMVACVRASGVTSTLPVEPYNFLAPDSAGTPFHYGPVLKLDEGYSSSISIDRVHESGVVSAYNLKAAGAPLYSGKTDLLSISPASGVITSADNDTFTLTDPVAVSVTNIDSSKIEVAYLSNLTKIGKVRSIRNMDNISLISNDTEAILGTSISPFISKYNNAIDTASFEGGVFGVLHNDGDNTEHNYPASLTMGTATLANPLRFVVFIDPTTDAISAPDGIANYNDLVELYEAIHNNIKDDDTTRWTGKIAIPVQSVKRYGESYPESWVSDATASGVYKKTINIDENFAPWNFPPRGEITSASYTGPGTSVELMNFYAKNLVASRANRFGKTRFASVTKTGLPEVSFDDFALQEFSTTGATSGLYGVPNHGISDMGVQFGTGGYQTSYGLKSHFAEFGRPAPLGENERLPFGNIIKPFRFDVLSLPPISDGSGRDEFRTLPPVISIENGNLVIEDTNKGGGKDDVGTIVGTATPDTLTSFLNPLDVPRPASYFEDTLDNYGVVTKRRTYHWKQDNLSDWQTHESPAFKVDTSGNGYLYIDETLGNAGTPILKHIYKADTGFNADNHRVIACSLDIATIEEDLWAGIILESATTNTTFFCVGKDASANVTYKLKLRHYHPNGTLLREDPVNDIEPMGANIFLLTKRSGSTTTFLYYSLDGVNWSYAGQLESTSGGGYPNPGSSWEDLDRVGVGYDWEGPSPSNENGNISFDWVAHT